MSALKSKQWGITKPPAGSSINWGDSISSGLVGYWLFNEDGGDIVKNSARINNGSLIGVSKSVGKFGRALEFNGTTSYISIVANPQTGLAGDYTTSFWIYPTSGSGFRPIYDRDSGVLECYLYNSTDLVTLHNRSGSIHYKFWPLLTLNVWTYVTIVFSGATWSVYYNTIPQSGSGEVGTAAPVASAGAITVGIFAVAPGFYAGKMDNFRLYSRALNPNEVKRLYQEPFAGIVEPNLRLRSGTVVAGASFVYIGRFF